LGDVLSYNSWAVGTGTKAFLCAYTGPYAVGDRVRVESSASSAVYMRGIVTAVSADSSIVVSVENTGGSGTYASWIIYPDTTQTTSNLMVYAMMSMEF
jgi:hypothetical protein